VGVSYICTTTFSCCCLLQLSTTKKNKQEREEQSCSLVHWSSNVTTQWHLCWLTMSMTQMSMCLEMSTKTWHGTHFILSSGGKMGFVPCDTIFFKTIVFPISPCRRGKHEFLAPCLNVECWMNEFELLYWKLYCMPSGKLGPWMLPISNIKWKL
jgi:hypothetical protein